MARLVAMPMAAPTRPAAEVNCAKVERGNSRCANEAEVVK